MLAGKVAIVTGGAAVSTRRPKQLAREGARVVVADIDSDGARRQAAAISEFGGQAHGMCADIADEAAVQQMIAVTVERFGGIDILHNNASAMNLTPDDTDLLSLGLGVGDGTMSANLRGTMLCGRHAIPHI